ncbi:hypothetical protein [Nocardioides sp. YIM 152315]|uniref:hypothetical protein n=1 Tax=Nocardioides sp. YIM 152315 TaxID=3031760 RepID=UPI0023DC3DC8|nr:hypothetical protein [Nocardioides sp. YIM 152315]MDF1603095.1 hypothetical protein [Nocardioides sp. YIM 152315]
MSKERARRRAEREAAAAALATARAAEAERKRRRDARVRALTRWVPRGTGRQTGMLAERRRTRTRLLIVAVVAVNVLVWLASGDWALRAVALLLSVLVAPLLHILLTSGK